MQVLVGVGGDIEKYLLKNKRNAVKWSQLDQNRDCGLLHVLE
jgi:hypothetical protein